MTVAEILAEVLRGATIVAGEARLAVEEARLDVDGTVVMYHPGGHHSVWRLKDLADVQVERRVEPEKVEAARRKLK